MFSELDEFGEFAGVAMALLALPIGALILSYFRGGPRQAMLTGFGGASGALLDLGSSLIGRTRHVVSRGFGGASGNQAFDEYRADTLRQLKDEQREFEAFLGRLGQARDKAEFDAFMAERRGISAAPTQVR